MIESVDFSSFPHSTAIPSVFSSWSVSVIKEDHYIYLTKKDVKL